MHNVKYPGIEKIILQKTKNEKNVKKVKAYF